MKYTAIVKDGGLFIPNVFSELDDDQAHIVQVTLDIDTDSVHEQLNTDVAPKMALEPKAAAPKTMTQKTVAPKRYAKKQTKRGMQDADLQLLRESQAAEFEAFDDIELSEMLKAYMNNEQDPS